MSYSCHYCGEKLAGKPKFAVAMIMGFVWNPSRFVFPAWFFDYCHDCKDVYVAKYEEGREMRRRQVEEQKSRNWVSRFGIIRKDPGYSLAYRERFKKPVGVIRNRCGQMEYHFSNN